MGVSLSELVPRRQIDLADLAGKRLRAIGVIVRRVVRQRERNCTCSQESQKGGLS